MNKKSYVTEKEIKLVKRTRENIERITQDLILENFKKGTPVFYEILEGRLKGYTPANCPHPFWVADGQFYICTQCGHEEMT